jgi:hypothetical protein
MEFAILASFDVKNRDFILRNCSFSTPNTSYPIPLSFSLSLCLSHSLLRREIVVANWMYFYYSKRNF